MTAAAAAAAAAGPIARTRADAAAANSSGPRAHLLGLDAAAADVRLKPPGYVVALHDPHRAACRCRCVVGEVGEGSREEGGVMKGHAVIHICCMGKHACLVGPGASIHRIAHSSRSIHHRGCDGMLHNVVCGWLAKGTVSPPDIITLQSLSVARTHAIAVLTAPAAA